MQHHSELINLIAQVIGAKTYVEIGVFNPAHNFNKVEVENKIGIDPDPAAGASMTTTSDKAFALFKELFAKPHLVFIDGLHHADQVKLDIQNAWDLIPVGGVIVVHDSNPHSEHITHVPRDNREWTGDVYKTISQLYTRPKFTVDMDYGCCVIRKEESSTLAWNEEPVTWEIFTENRKELLNLIPVDEAVKIISTWKPISE